MELINLTPFPAKTVLGFDPQGAETLAVVLKATFKSGNEAIHVCDKQEPIHLADEYRGEPDKSSIKYAADCALFKPQTDVILSGHAYAPGGKAKQADVTLSVASIHKTIRVFGDRFWKKGLLSPSAGAPEPFELIPLVYERAFGGTDLSVNKSERRNPAGVGFRGRGSKMEVIGTPLPNLENPDELMRGHNHRPSPAGFGPIGPHWVQRAKYAGTYDKNWFEKVAPMLPEDYNPLFQQTAPPDQIIPYLKGGEPVEVINASPGGCLSCSVPTLHLKVVVRIEEERCEIPMNLDTLFIDGDQERISCTFRGNISVHGRVYDVEWIKVSVQDGGNFL